MLLDASELAGDAAYLELGQMAVSPDERLLAYSYDVRGESGRTPPGCTSPHS